MAADGSIIIETRLDTDGIDGDLEKIKGSISKKMGDAQDAVESVMDAIAEAISNPAAAAGGEVIISALAAVLRAGGGKLSTAMGLGVSEAAKGVENKAESFSRGGKILSEAVAAGANGGAKDICEALKSVVKKGADAIVGENSGFLRAGENLMSALKAGIVAGESSIYAKAASVASAVVSKFKAVFKIHSPSRVFRDEIGKMLIMGLRDGICQNQDAVLEAVEDLAADMLESEKRYLEEKERIEREQAEIDERELIREYNKKIAAAKTWQDKEELIWEEKLRLKKNADKKYLEQLKSQSEDEREVMDALKEDITQTYKEIAEYAEESMEDIVENRDKLAKKLTEYVSESGGHTKNTFTYETTEKTVVGARKNVEETIEFFTLNDQQKSIDALKKYASALEKVKERLEKEFSAEIAVKFMHSLAEKDVDEATEFAQVLGDAAADEFEDYIEKWVEKNELAQAVAQAFFSDEFEEAVEDSTDYMRQRLEQLGLEIPEGFFASGTLSAQQFGKGFVQGINDVLEEARKMVTSFEATASVSGAKSGEVINNNNFYSNYSINGTKSTVAESIYAAEAAATRNKYRGIEAWS